MKMVLFGPLIIILIMSLFVNLWGINHDMPYCYEHDEINFVVTALSFGRGNFEPPSFYHGSFTYYFLFLEYATLYFFKALTGSMHSGKDFMLYYIKHPEIFYLIGRISMAILASFSVFLIYQAGNKLTGRLAGILAALFLASSLLFVNLAHLIKEDIIYIFFLLLSFLCVIYKNKNSKLIYLAAFFIGIATSVKYLAALGIVFVLSGFLNDRRLKPREIIKGFTGICIFILLGFFLCQPYSLIHMRSFLLDIRGLKGHIYNSPIGDGSKHVWFSYMVYLKRSLGVGIFAAFLMSLISVFNKRRLKINLLILPYIALYLLFLFKGAHPQTNYLMGAIPFICIYTGIFVDDVIPKLLNHKLQKTSVYLTAGFLLSLPSFINVLRYDYLLTKPDTRAVGKEWVEKNIPENSTILLEGAFPWEIAHNAPLVENEACLREELKKIKSRGGKGLLWETRISQLNKINTPKYFIEKEDYFEGDSLDHRDTDYVIVCSFYDHGFWVSRKDREIFYGKLRKRYSLMKRLEASPYIVWFPSFNTLRENPENLKYVNFLRKGQGLVAGPNLDIYKRKPGGGD